MLQTHERPRRRGLGRRATLTVVGTTDTAERVYHLRYRGRFLQERATGCVAFINTPSTQEKGYFDDSRLCSICTPRSRPTVLVRPYPRRASRRYWQLVPPSGADRRRDPPGRPGRHSGAVSRRPTLARCSRWAGRPP